VNFQAFLAESFDSTFVAFLAALEAGSADPTKLAAHVRSLTNDPGANYDFTQLDQAIKAILAGQKIHFNGATGPINFGENGRISAASYDIWQHMPDGSAKVVKTIKFTP